MSWSPINIFPGFWQGDASEKRQAALLLMQLVMIQEGKHNAREQSDFELKEFFYAAILTV